MIFFVRFLGVFAYLILNNFFKEIIELIRWRDKFVCFANVNHYRCSDLCAQWDFNVNFINLSLDAVFVRWDLRTFISHLFLSSRFFSLFFREVYLSVREINLRTERISSLTCVYIFTSECEIGVDEGGGDSSFLWSLGWTRIRFLSVWFERLIRPGGCCWDFVDFCIWSFGDLLYTFLWLYRLHRIYFWGDNDFFFIRRIDLDENNKRCSLGI